MDTSLQFRPEDRLQKTWIPEGTEEYKVFKLTTLENNFLSSLLKNGYALKNSDLILDVGGREGDIARSLHKGKNIHLVDPDPTLKVPFQPGRYWNKRIQDIELTDKYSIIICSHVLGYLGTQHVQDSVFKKLLEALKPGGTLVLFYNTNEGYMNQLLEFSRKILVNGHYDYFDEKLLAALDPEKYSVTKQDISFTLNYPSFKDLARCCWFLFGAKDQNIEKVALSFMPKLEKDLESPEFEIGERVAFVQKIK